MYKKLNTKVYTKQSQILTNDELYWKKFEAPVLVKEFGPIDYLDFSSVEPFCFAVTCSVRVQVYNPITKLVVKNLSRFRESAYGGSFRGDGRLLCAGGEESNVKLFDVNSKSLLRIFKGHTAAVHRCFFTQNKVHIASFSDDKTVKVWDIPTETAVSEFGEHQDYIRAGAVSPVSSDIVLSGGYDHAIKMYDRRTGQTALSVQHGAPVESLLFLQTGGIFLSAGGPDIKVWDCLAGGKLMGTITQHHKTVTCLRQASAGKKILSGSLDRHVKVYDVGTFEVVHSMTYPNAVLSLAVSPHDETVVAGMVDGLVSVRRKADEKPSKKAAPPKKTPHYSATKFPDTVDAVVTEVSREQQSRYDRFLRSFQFSKALDSVLLPYVVNKNPHVTISVMQDLMRKEALGKALAGRDSKRVKPVVKFLCKYINDYRFNRILIDVAHIFLDIYEDSIHLIGVDAGKSLLALAKKLQDEVALAEQLAHLQGAMELLMAGAHQPAISHQEADHVHSNLQPSEDAQKNLVVNLT